MRIVTYNIHGWRTADNRPNLTGVGDVLEHMGPDIIGLNEVYYPRVVEGSDKPALEALAERLGMHFVFGAALRWPAQDDMPEDAYGNALLSRWPIIANAAHHLTSKEEDPQGLLATSEERGLLEGRFAFRGARPLPPTRSISTTPTRRCVGSSCAWRAPGWAATATGRTSSWATSTPSACGTSRAATADLDELSAHNNGSQPDQPPRRPAGDRPDGEGRLRRPLPPV